MRCGDGIDPLLLRPFSMLTADREAGTLDILYQVVGRGTDILVNRRAGEEILQLGPLGKTFTTPSNPANLLMVGGGIGIAPLVYLAETMIPAGYTVTLLAGARTAARHLPAEHVPPEVEYVLATDDGSAGYHGPVTNLIAEYYLWRRRHLRLRAVADAHRHRRRLSGRNLGPAQQETDSGLPGEPDGVRDGRLPRLRCYHAAWLPTGLPRRTGLRIG